MIRGRPVLVSPGCGIAQWPDLSEGLFRIAEGETLLDAVRRVRNLDPVDRRRVAERGRAAAVRLHERTIDDWLSTLVQAASGRGA
jgi:hypothetical protein